MILLICEKCRRVLINIFSLPLQDHDKVRCNSVRALGNLCRFGSASLLNAHMPAVVHALLSNLAQGSVKVRWNCAYAIGNVLKNNTLTLEPATWRATFIEALLETVRDCKNFKIRINATQSLACVPTRAQYPDPQYAKLWEVSHTTPLQRRISTTATSFSIFFSFVRERRAQHFHSVNA